MKVQFDKVVNLYHNGVEFDSVEREVLDLSLLTDEHTITITDMLLYISECKYDYKNNNIVCNHYRVLKGDVDDWDELTIYLFNKYSCKCL